MWHSGISGGLDTERDPVATGETCRSGATTRSVFSETTGGVGIDLVCLAADLLMKPLMHPTNQVIWRGNMRARMKAGAMDPPVVATLFS